jgi:hypothetical protein
VWADTSSSRGSLVQRIEPLLYKLVNPRASTTPELGQVADHTGSTSASASLGDTGARASLGARGATGQLGLLVQLALGDAAPLRVQLGLEAPVLDRAASDRSPSVGDLWRGGAAEDHSEVFPPLWKGATSRGNLEIDASQPDATTLRDVVQHGRGELRG